MTVQSTALIVFISTILGHTGSAVTPVVTFTPNWRKIFTEESITMRCDVGSSGGDLTYIWYKDGNWISAEKIYTIISAITWNSGDYSCQAGTERSDTTRLDVVFGSVILQVPLHVHEGDDLTLRCHHRSGYTGNYTMFYKEDSVIQNWRETSEFHVGIVNMMNIGRYKCTKGITPNTWKTYVPFTDEASISIHKLFEIPEINVTSYPVVEGDEMTLTCDTSLSPLRPRTQLKFAFHKDGRNVREFTSYNQYGFQSAQVKDSGKYSCEVTTAANSVKKRSLEILVEINELFVNPTIMAIRCPMTEGDHMILNCFILSPHRQRAELQFAFYKDGENVQEFHSSNQYGVQSAQLEDSGNYSCDVRSSNGKVRKRSHFIFIKIKVMLLASLIFFVGVNNMNPPGVPENQTLIKVLVLFTLLILNHKAEMTVRSTALIVFISTILGHTGSAVTPVVTFTPNWRKIFTGESITMTCDVGSSGGEDLTYVWYKDGPVILQVPLHVHEGDDLTLRCHHHSDYTARYTIFYKEDSVIQNWRETSEFHVGIVNMTNIGRYKCTKEITPNTWNTYVFFTDEAFISIHKQAELIAQRFAKKGYDQQLIRDKILEVKEMDRKELIRDKTRNETTLAVAPIILDFNAQHKRIEKIIKRHWHILLADKELQDKLPPNPRFIYKKAPTLRDKIVKNIIDPPKKVTSFFTRNELFINPTIKAIRYPEIEGDNMTLICDTNLSPLRQRTELQFAFYRDGRNVQEFSSSDQYGVQSIQLEDSGNYSCKVRSASNISKKSEDVFVQIREKSSKHAIPIIIVTLLVLLLVATFLLFKYRHKLHWPTTGCPHQRRGLQPEPQISPTCMTIIYILKEYQ
ncbi:uncharacterized protein [Aquarana catesbeiana]|uniref:uncharacterized protein n=1 Tax=Aquarana catesbeiana TaxID=8400 RepID=UPI003CC96D9F